MQQSVNVPFLLPLIYLYLASYAYPCLLGTFSAPGTSKSLNLA